MSSNNAKRRQTGKVCANCTITVSPVWRHAKGLDLTLCNACHICWVTKGVHRPIPPPEVMAKIIAAATKKAEAPARAGTSLELAALRSTSSCDIDSVGGKRKRVARKWGTDIDTYGEGSLGRSESEESTDQEIIISTNSSAYDQTPFHQQMNVFDAAKVMMTLKKAKYSHEETIRRSPAKDDSSNPGRPVRKGSAKKDCSVTLTLEGKRKYMSKTLEVMKPNEQKRCQNCGVTETPVWRKAGGQYPLCNACGVSKRAHGVDRKPPSVGDDLLSQGMAVGSEFCTGPTAGLEENDDSLLHMYPQAYLPQVVEIQAPFVQDFCPMTVASPMVRCGAQLSERYEILKLDMKRSLFAEATKKCLAPSHLAAEETSVTTYFS